MKGVDGRSEGRKLVEVDGERKRKEWIEEKEG